MKKKVMNTLIEILEKELDVIDSLTFGYNDVLKKHIDNAKCTKDMMKQCLEGTCFEKKNDN